MPSKSLPTQSSKSAWLAIFLMTIGGFCIGGGVILAVLRVLEPDKTAISLPMTGTPSPTVPTLAHLADIPVALPPLKNEALPQIMPVMEVVSASTPSASLQPSATLTPFPPSSTSISPTMTPTSTPMPSPTSSPSATSRPAISTHTPSTTPIPSPWPTFPADEIDDLSAMTNGGAFRATLRATTTASRPIPDRIEIPAIDLNAPIVAVGWQTIDLDGATYSQWEVPEMFASGWHNTSATLGHIGNTVLNGHHNAWERVFGELIEVQPGDDIILYAGETSFTYTVVQTMILPERDQPISVRLENARWLLPSPDERVTLVTCWPQNDNSHRLVVLALPADDVQRWLARQQFDNRNQREFEP